MAMRMEKINEDLIAWDQNGFLKGRSTQYNIRTVAEVIAHVNKHNKPLVLATINYEKCFDRVEFSAIKGAMEYFGFSPCFVSRNMTLLTEFQVCTQNGGYLSDFFPKTRGCFQGYPKSPTAFLYCSKLMAHQIKQNI